MTHDQYIRRAAPSTSSGVRVDIGPADAGWDWCGLTVVELEAGGVHSFDTEDNEVIILPLAGSFDVESGDDHAHLKGRPSVFTGVSDFVYVGRGRHVVVTSQAGGRVAVPQTRARESLPFRHVPASAISVELRGTGSCSRQVNNFCTPDTFEADRMIACEVLTPGGNWSSYPPHKHDVEREGETALEEIYYFEIADGPHGPGMAYQRVYSSDAGPIDVLEEVRSGDAVLIPHGWHGPSIAAPGYDLYYLNVMAGPGKERLWLICDDPAHAWVRQTWESQDVDPRLPLTRA